MVLHTWTDGNVLYSVDLLGDFQDLFTLKGLDAIKQLIDRAGVWSAGMIDGWGDAYVDADGREDSVDTGNTTAVWSTEDTSYHTDITDKASGDSTSNPDSFTNPENAFDGDTGTSATKSESGTITLGKTFSSELINSVRIKAVGKANVGGSVCTATLKLQTYNGSTWDDEVTLDTATGYGTRTASFDGFHELNSTVEGIRVAFINSSDSPAENQSLYLLEYGDAVTRVIVQDIPTGTFNTAISAGIGVPLINYLGSGGNIQVKFENGSENSGYIDYNEVDSFTIFASGEPTKITVNLVPSAAGISIKGFWVRAT